MHLSGVCKLHLVLRRGGLKVWWKSGRILGFWWDQFSKSSLDPARFLRRGGGFDGLLHQLDFGGVVY